MKKILLILTMLLMTSVSYASNSYNSITLNENNTLVFRGPVNGYSVDLYGQQLLEASNNVGPDETIYLVLDSGGGQIFAGMQFISLMKSIPQNIECISIFAASMAHGILQACPGNRYIAPAGVSMIHRARGGFQGQFNDGEVEARLEFWKSIVNAMEAINAERMGLTIETYQKLAKDEFWCSAKNCVKYSFVDALVGINCAPGLANKTFTYQNRFYLSKCPLIRKPVGQVRRNSTRRVPRR